VTAGLDEPLLFGGCVAEVWAIVAVVRADRTARVAKPRRLKVLLLCVKHVGLNVRPR
jgi:hypothetical protein